MAQPRKRRSEMPTARSSTVGAVSDRAFFVETPSHPTSRQRTRGQRPRLQLRASVFLLAVLLTASAAAQEQHDIPRSQIERKTLAPVSKDILKVSLPKATEATLPNGLTVLVMEDHKLPFVSMEFFMSGAGPLFEPAD